MCYDPWSHCAVEGHGDFQVPFEDDFRLVGKLGDNRAASLYMSDLIELDLRGYISREMFLFHVVASCRDSI